MLIKKWQAALLRQSDHLQASGFRGRLEIAFQNDGGEPKIRLVREDKPANYRRLDPDANHKVQKGVRDSIFREEVTWGNRDAPARVVDPPQ